MPIYVNHKNGIITNQTHYELLERRGVKFLKIKRTKTFKNMQDIEIEVLAEHVWTITDKLHLLSHRFYGTSEYWWTIGIVNGKPTDCHYAVGDIVYLPKDPGFLVESTR